MSHKQSNKRIDKEKHHSKTITIKEDENVEYTLVTLRNALTIFVNIKLEVKGNVKF